MTRLFVTVAALLFVLGLPAPAVCDEPPPGLTERLDRLGRLPTELVKARKTDAETVEALYLATIARLPTEKEKDTVAKHLANAKDRAEAARDIAWALVNSKEFAKLHGLDKDVAASLRILNTLGEKWGREKE
jgi:hypothetical protein